MLEVILFSIITFSFGWGLVYIFTDEELPKLRRAPKLREEAQPTHVSWLEIDGPLLTDWERRFRLSLGPIPDEIEALNHLALQAERDYKILDERWGEELRKRNGRYLDWRSDTTWIAKNEKSTEVMQFRKLYHQEVRKFYHLPADAAIDLKVPALPA